jgi:hypothetical protein
MLRTTKFFFSQEVKKLERQFLQCLKVVTRSLFSKNFGQFGHKKVGEMANFVIFGKMDFQHSGAIIV